MKRFRSAMAGLLAMLLILSSFPAYAADGGSTGTGGTGASQIPAGPVLIKNKWKNNFLYETANGIVRYGMTNPADTSSHWLVVTENGLSQIKNVKTGHYITLAGNAGKEDSLKTGNISGGGTTADKWLIDTSNRAGYMVIRSATAPDAKLVIHQENQLGYAQVSADINVTFESPQWAFVDLNSAPVRLESREHPGHVMYESDGKVLHGEKDAKDETAQWYLEPGSEGGILMLRNRATGHYIKQNVEFWLGVFSADIDPDNVKLSQWVQEDAPSGDGAGYITLRNFGMTDNGAPQWLNSQFPGDNDVRSNNWPGSAATHSAQWRIVPVSELQPIRLATYTDAQAATDFLYEAADGQLKHGTIAPDAASGGADYLWYVEDFNGNKRIRNAATNHYLMYGDGTVRAVQIAESGLSDQWIFKESDDVDDYQTIGNVSNTNVFLAIENGGNAGSSSDPASLQAQWQLLDPAAPIDGSEHYIRIQNGWKSFYWYESSDGLLKYGNMQEDQSDQWLVEKYNGRKLFKNRKTGHYINIASMPEGHIRVSALADKANVDPGFIWTGKNTGDNIYVVSNVADKHPNERPTKYISLQNLTKYAEYGVINPTWGSPQWRFVPVTEKKHDVFRFKLNNVNGEDQYLQDGPLPEPALDLAAVKATVTETTYDPESDNAVTPENDVKDAPEPSPSAKSATALADDMTVGQATYGTLVSGDDSFIWQLQEIPGANGAVKIKNRGTGRYLSLEHLGGVIEQDEPAEAVQTLKTVYDVWASIKWVVDIKSSGAATIKSAWAGHYLYGASDQDGHAVIKISKAADAATRDNSQFTAEPVIIPEPPVPSYPVRFKNAGSGDYLYENEHGVVLYGQPAADNGYSHWIISAKDGKQYIVNRATGHYLTLSEEYSFLESTGVEPASGGASGWAVKLSSDGVNYTIRSLFGEHDDEFVNVENRTGYAERGLLLESSESVHWALETATAEFNTPAGEPRNQDTATPILSDTNTITIAPKGVNGKVLAEKDGAVVYAEPADSAAHSKWLVQDFNGRKLVLNQASKKYLSIDDNDQIILTANVASVSAQWTLEEKLGYNLLVNSKNGKVLAHSSSEVILGAAKDDAAQWSFTPVSSDVVYSGKDAFHGDQVIRFAVNAATAGEYIATLRYKNNSDNAVATQLDVNGIKQGSPSFNASSTWRKVQVKMKLRAGINTVALSSDSTSWGGIEVDSLTVHNSVNKTYRGATLPYITYEAEDGVTNGTLIGPSRKYRNVASEASGREAVSLNNTGDYVEFTLAKPANSIVLRYSIPDSPDGKGAEETLSMYVNGTFKQQLKLTSKYAWEYGSYPWSNDPAQGSAHRFFDEIHALTGDLPAGAKITLKKDKDDRASSYIIDLADMEQVAPALRQPAGFLSVTEYGAVPNDGKDDTAAFKAALAAAKSKGVGVWFPAGEFEVGDGLLDLDSIQIRGAGMWYTTLNGAKFVGHGGKIGVYDLLIEGGINERDDEAITNAFHGAFGQGSVIQNVWIEHTKAGLWLTQVSGEKARTNGLHMVGLRIRNLMADGINFAVGTGNSMMEQTDIRYPGDDGIAMWSFTDEKLKDVNGAERTPSVNNTARFNTVTLPWLADNIVVFGGKDNKIQDNVVKDTVTNGAGIAVSTRFSAEPFEGTTVVERNTMIRTGSYDSGYGVNLGALWLYAGESDIKGDIKIENNIALDSTYSGLIVHGSMKMNGVSIINHVIDGAGTNGIDVTPDLQGSLLADNVIIRGERMTLVSNPTSGFIINELNQGVATAIKPFAISLADGQNGPVVLTVGDSAELTVKGKDGSDLTDSATLTFVKADNKVASFDGHKLKALSEGTALFTVAAGNVQREYSVIVKPVGGKPDDGSSDGDDGMDNSYIDPDGGTTPGTNPGTNPGSSNPSVPVVTPTAANNDAQLKAKTAAGLAVIEIPANADGTARFSAEALRNAATASPNAVLVMQNSGLEYRLPLSLVADVLKGAGHPDGTLEFKLEPQSGTTLEQLLAKAKQQGFTVKGTPANFGLSVSDGKTSVPVSGFGTTHVDRTLIVKEVLNPQTAVALLYDPVKGNFSYVPAVFTVENGVTKVTVKSSSANGIIAIALHPVTFTDVTGHWAKAEIERLASRLIVNGQSAGQFVPNGSVSRAEFAAMLVRSLDLQPGKAAGASFSDVPAAAWYAESANIAAQLGIVQGYEDGSFRPNASITREQMAVMAARALKLLNVAEGTGKGAASFKDADSISSWATEAVDLLTATGIMKGQTADSFAPGRNTSRAEAAVILTRVLGAAGLLNN
ncbi:S-layer homology domain-containing protein [Paenibacillus sp. NPDC056722]|uniref:S-layer homology domain-containing protein n=1 Tax=Paenibacillus sp. NPDC056722 TaxID=3345924 RepID=UPI00368412A7